MYLVLIYSPGSAGDKLTRTTELGPSSALQMNHVVVSKYFWILTKEPFLSIRDMFSFTSDCLPVLEDRSSGPAGFASLTFICIRMCEFSQ